jgi:hypothetical protein
MGEFRMKVPSLIRVAGRAGIAVLLLGFGFVPAVSVGADTGTAVVPTVVDVAALPDGVGVKQVALQFLFPAGQSALDVAKMSAASYAPRTGIQDMSVAVSSGPPPSSLGGGVGVNQIDTTCGCIPPDGGFAVSPSYLMAAANTAFKIFNSSGGLVAGPKEFSAFWGTACMTNFSDPVLEYDNASGRFVFSVVSYDSKYNSTLCMAVSATGNPTRKWYRYSFVQKNPALTNDLLDQPRFAIGSDAIYATGNQFEGSTTYFGPRVIAINKAQMYAGAATSWFYHDLSSNYDTLNPARNIGTSASPYTEPGYFISVDSNICPPTCTNLYEWKWTSPFPNGGTFTMQGSVPITPFAQPVNAVQKGAGAAVQTNDARDLAAFYSKGTIYGVHSITCLPPGSTALTDCVQWYQLGNVDGTPSLLQQGILGATGEFRYYPSLAVDRAGNVIMGYSFSSANDYIGTRYTGRLSGDPLNTMRSEATLKAGEGTNIDAAIRWGDYAATAIAPDGCRAFHFEEFAPANEIFNDWSTWYGILRFPSC